MSFMANPISLTPRRDMSEDGENYSNVHAEALREFRKRVIVIDKKQYTMKLKTYTFHVPIIHPRKDMCLCGLLSLPRSVQLVCAIEVFFSMVLLLQSPDLLKMDGTYFYFLGLFDGKGSWFFLLHIIACLSCVFTSALLSLGIRMSLPHFLFPHLLWQVSFICLCIALTTIFLTLGFYGRMLLPASVVLSVLLVIPASFELWWSFLTFQLISQMKVYGEAYQTEKEESSFGNLPYYSTEI